MGIIDDGRNEGGAMHISLSDHSQELIAYLIRQGRFRSATETVEEALRLLDEREAKRSELRAPIDASLSGPQIFADGRAAATASRWQWLDAIVGPVDEDFARAALEHPGEQEGDSRAAFD